MESEIEQLQKLLKSHRRSLKYLSSLNNDELRTLLKEVIEPNLRCTPTQVLRLLRPRGLESIW